MPQYEVTLRDYGRIVWKRRWIILLVFISIIISVSIYTELLPPVYQASAAVKITQKKTLALLMTEIFTYAPGDPMETQARVARSWPVIEKVVRNPKLNLVSPDASNESINQTIRSIQDRITTEVVKNTDIIKITVSHFDPKQTALLAEATVQSYVEVNLEEKRAEAENLRKYLSERVQEIKKTLDELAEKRRIYKETYPEVTGVAIPLYNKLDDLKKEHTALLRKYTEKHPDVERLNHEIASLTKELGRFSQQEIEFSALERDYKINDSLYADLKQKLTTTEIEAVQVPDVTVVDHATIPLSPISPNKTLNRIAGLVIGLLVSLALGFVVDHLDTSLGTIEEIESLLQLPVLGIIPYLKSAQIQPRDTEFGILKWFIRIFAGRSALPKVVSREALRSQLILNYTPTSPITEAYRILTTNTLKDEGTTKTPYAKIILCTSTGPQEGKSITAANLSITMAQKGATVLLIDLDLRKSVLHRIFGIDKEPGLSNLLLGSNKIDESVRTIADTLIGSATTSGLDWNMVLATPGIDNLHILPAGSTVFNPAELLGSQEMNRVWSELRSRYEYLVCDCPPVLPVTDVLIVGPKPDTTVLLIYRAGRTAKGALVRAKEQLTTAGIKIKGIVLNHMSPEIEVSSTYYYHYYKYYPSEQK